MISTLSAKIQKFLNEKHVLCESLTTSLKAVHRDRKKIVKQISSLIYKRKYEQIPKFSYKIPFCIKYYELICVISLVLWFFPDPPVLDIVRILFALGTFHRKLKTSSKADMSL